MFQRHNIFVYGDKLEVVWNQSNVSQHAFFFEHRFDKSRDAWNEEKCVCMPRGLLRVSLDLVWEVV